MATLFVYRQGNDSQAVAIWPPSGQTLPHGLIEEAKDYCFELREVDDPDSADLYIDDQPLQALRNPNENTAKWSWSPKFYAGQIRIRLYETSSGNVDVDLVVDADQAKLTRDEFDTMLRDILEDTTALFGLSGFRVGISKGTGGNTPPLARLEFIRSRIRKIEQAIADIVAKPVRVLADEITDVSAQSARRLNARDIYRSYLAKRLNAAPVGFSIGSLPLPALPVKFSVRSKSATEDIHEHRAIKSCLNFWRTWLLITAEQISASGLPQSTKSIWSQRCLGMATRLNRLLSLPFFEEVSNSRTLISATPIFRRVLAYQRFLSLYRDMNLGIAQIQGDFLNLPISRTFELYELWVFLRMCRAAIQHFGLGIEISSFFQNDRAILGIAYLTSAPILNLPNGVKLCFQREYREYWRDEHNTGSFSRSMIPDLAFETASDKPFVVVLDAKYRVGSQLGDALSSIHMYRDAIVKETKEGIGKIVVASYLVSPFSPITNVDWKNADIEHRLFYPEYRQKFRFGAVTLKPGHTIEDAVEVLKSVLKDAAA